MSGALPQPPLVQVTRSVRRRSPLLRHQRRGLPIAEPVVRGFHPVETTTRAVRWCRAWELQAGPKHARIRNIAWRLLEVVKRQADQLRVVTWWVPHDGIGSGVLALRQQLPVVARGI